MLVICYGMMKSASTFVFQLTTDIVKFRSKQEQLRKLLSDDLKNHFQRNLDERILEIDSIIPKDEIYVIKTHSPLNDLVKDLLETGRIKAIISYRNPYDIAVSLKDMGERERQSKHKGRRRKRIEEIYSYEDALELIPNILESAYPWMDYANNTLKIPFPKIAEMPYAVAQEIALYMDIMNVNTNQIIEAYKSNKKSIREFNVGVQGRGNQEINLPQENPLKKQMDDFINKYMLAYSHN